MNNINLIEHRNKYCGKNFIINIINVLHDISYTLIDCSSGIRIESNTITNTHPYIFLEKKFADYDYKNPINYIFNKDDGGYDGYKKSRLIINNYRTHLHIIERPFEIDTHFTLSHRLESKNLPHIYFNLAINSSNEIVFKYICSSVKNINSTNLQCFDNFILPTILKVNDVVFCSHILNLNFLCKNISNTSTPISFDIHNSYINENKLRNLGTLTDEEKKIYLIYADTTYFMNLYKLSFEQLFNLFRDILKYTPIIPGFTKSLLNPQTISDNDPKNPPSIHTTSCYNNNFSSVTTKYKRDFFSSIKKKYNCNNLYDKNWDLLTNLDHTKLINLYTNRTYFDTIKDSVNIFMIKLNLWSKNTFELEKIYFQTKYIFDFYKNDIINVPIQIKSNIDHLLTDIAIFKLFRDCIKTLVTYKILNSGIDKPDIKYTDLPIRLLENSKEFAKINNDNDRNNFYNLMYSIMKYDAPFKNFDIINNLKKDSGEILNPTEFLENIIQPKYLEIEKIKLDEIKRSEKEASVTNTVKLEEPNIVNIKNTEGEQITLKNDNDIIQENNSRISKFFETLKKCWRKTQKNYECINIQLKNILTDAYFNNFIFTSNFKTNYLKLLDEDIFLDYEINNNNYLPCKDDLDKYFNKQKSKKKNKSKTTSGGEVNYYSKYLKYKLKYLDLKNIIIN